MKRSRILALSMAGLTATVLSAGFILSGWPGHTSPRSVPIAKGWAKNQVNTVIFRRSSIISRGNDQYVAFYDEDSNMVLAKRRLGTDRWKTRPTQYRGNTKDAHNSISIAIDGDGFLHVAWSSHDSRLQYCRSTRPGSLQLSAQTPMTGVKEGRVTYPEFYALSGGNLLFLYRDGASGDGSLMMNRYDLKTRRWKRVQDGLISGEGKRNAYWQATVDTRGTIHLSWVWRESPDVATNHDICYARSSDGGKTWRRSSGDVYRLPITAGTSEYAARIGPGSDLINQTSMCADADGRPYIATYWRPKGTRVPQYQLVYHDGRKWQTSQISRRTMPFRLGGKGTRRIPISRPQIVIDSRGTRPKGFVIFRDSERGGRVSVATSVDLGSGTWRERDLTDRPVGYWEPTYDQNRWDSRGELHLFVQRVGQGEGEGVETIPPQVVSVLEWKPK